MEKNRIVFLGTGGGKNVMFSQVRKTGGIYIKLDETRFVIDPGPGCLVHAHNLKLKPEKWDCLLVSHFHPDHCTDANVILDGVFHSGKKPFLIAEKNCLKYNPRHKKYHQCISNYHQELAEITIGKPGIKVNINDVKVSIGRSDHYDPTIGFRISGSRRIGYPSDTTYCKDLEKNYEDCDVLILNVLIPRVRTKKIFKHMSVDDAIKLIKSIKKKPKLIIITHFTFWMLHYNIWAQARIIEKATGVKTIPAEDFMEVDLNNLTVKKLKVK